MPKVNTVRQYVISLTEAEYDAVMKSSCRLYQPKLLVEAPNVRVVRFHTNRQDTLLREMGATIGGEQVDLMKRLGIETEEEKAARVLEVSRAERLKAVRKQVREMLADSGYKARDIFPALFETAPEAAPEALAAASEPVPEPTVKLIKGKKNKKPAAPVEETSQAA